MDFPLTKAHSLVVPRRPVAPLYDLAELEQKAVCHVVAQVREQLVIRLGPDGFNIGLNDGPAVLYADESEGADPRRAPVCRDCRDPDDCRR
jgi:hypothetical protein